MTRVRRKPESDVLDGLRTPDGRYLVVRGRLWRAADPALDEGERAARVAALMEARRSIAQARRRGDAAAESRARQRVQRAKVALGERGPVWWRDGAPDLNRRMIHTTPYADWFERAAEWAATIERLLDGRDGGASICPSEVARAGMPRQWRRHLDEVRHVARHLARQDRLRITQRGTVVSPDTDWRGPVRLRRR